MHPWLGTWGVELPVEELTNPTARKFATYLTESAEGIATIRAARKDGGAELLVLDIHTGRPQQPVYALLRIEPIAVLFPAEDSPRVLALRDNFPDTPHQHWLPPEFPASLCIDDRPWVEAKSTFTSVELLDRILSWFRKAGRGELHDLAQALDPLFTGHAIELILPRSAWDAQTGSHKELIAFVAVSERPQHLIAVSAEEVAASARKNDQGLVVLSFDLSSQPMKRLRIAPRDLGLLDLEMSARGLPLVQEIAAKIAAWQADEQNKQLRLASQLCLLFRIPIIHPLTGEAGAISTVGFITHASIGEVGEHLGVLFRNTSGDQSNISYVSRTPAGAADPVKVSLGMALVHAALDGPLATELSGRATINSDRALLIGAGAIGSTLSETLTREGMFSSWAIVDHDTYLPHNVARHTLTAFDVGKEKSLALGKRLKKIRQDLKINAVDGDFLKVVPDERAKLLEDIDIVLDTSASVAVARTLCDLEGKQRRLSAFFNPSGTAGILLLEDSERESDLRSLEALYYRAVLRTDSLADHFGAVEMLPYSGACRTVTSRIPASRVQVLSGSIANAIPPALQGSSAMAKIWTLGPNGSIDVTDAIDPVTRRASGDWTISIPAGLEIQLRTMRSANLPAETGGALLGIIDIEAKRVELVDALSAPPDSEGSQAEFVRGTTGLLASVQAAGRRTLGQVRYVGEWHSHPPGIAATPSGTDLKQLAWLAQTLSEDGFPGVMVIVGEGNISILIGLVQEESAP